MKKYINAIVLVLFAVSVSAQDMQKSNAYYRAASRENRIIGYIFLGGGIALIATGALSNNKDFGVGKSLFTIGGVVFCLASIPFFNSAARDKKKIVTIGLGGQSLSVAGIEKNT
ncbi:MAG: hypothetical protein ABI675_09915 [Chitinophagaceae bacterium]